MKTIDPARVERLLKEVHLRSGSGSGINSKADACIMQAVDWLAGGDGKTDAPRCADPAIRGFCIRLNDAPVFSQWRDELKPYAARIVYTNMGKKFTVTRLFMCADWAIRRIVPLAFDYWAETTKVGANHIKAADWAAKLRACAPIVDDASAKAGRAAAKDAYAAAAAAADAAAAAAAAAAAYSAADAAAYADADADADADAAADADASADAGGFRRSMWDESLKLLDRLIAVTETAPQ
jgi:hypothetical protein